MLDVSNPTIMDLPVTQLLANGPVQIQEGQAPIVRVRIENGAVQAGPGGFPSLPVSFADPRFNLPGVLLMPVSALTPTV